MDFKGGRLGAVRVLVVLIAVLLPAGAFAATTVDGSQPTREAGRVGATGFSGELLAEDEPAVTPTVAVTSTVAPAATVTGLTTSASTPASTTASPPAPAPTVPRRTATTVPQQSMFPTPPGFPPLPMPTFPRLDSASTWSKSADGRSVRMHIEPATPVAGRPVTFVFDEVTAPVECCMIHLVLEGTTIPIRGSFGDDPQTGICGSPPVTRSGLAHTHTFAEPGVYAVLVMVLTFPCQMPAVGGPAVPPTGGLLDLPACLTVGPASAIRTENLPPRCTGA